MIYLFLYVIARAKPEAIQNLSPSPSPKEGGGLPL